MFLEIHPNDFEDGTKYAILTSYNVGIHNGYIRTLPMG